MEDKIVTTSGGNWENWEGAEGNFLGCWRCLHLDLGVVMWVYIHM